MNFSSLVVSNVISKKKVEGFYLKVLEGKKDKDVLNIHVGVVLKDNKKVIRAIINSV